MSSPLPAMPKAFVSILADIGRLKAKDPEGVKVKSSPRLPVSTFGNVRLLAVTFNPALIAAAPSATVRSPRPAKGTVKSMSGELNEALRSNSSIVIEKASPRLSSSSGKIAVAKSKANVMFRPKSTAVVNVTSPSIGRPEAPRSTTKSPPPERSKSKAKLSSEPTKLSSISGSSVSLSARTSSSITSSRASRLPAVAALAVLSPFVIPL